MQPSLIRTLLIKPFMIMLFVILLLMLYASTAGAVNGVSIPTSSHSFVCKCIVSRSILHSFMDGALRPLREANHAQV